MVGQQPLLQARRELRVHERREPADRGGHDARHLPDGGRRRPHVRRGDPGVHAVGAARAALTVASASARRRRRAARLRLLGAHRPPDDADRRSPARRTASRRIQPIAPRVPVAPRRGAWPAPSLAAAAIASPAARPRRRPPPATPRPRRRRRCRRTIAPSRWSELPGWRDDPVERGVAGISRRLPRAAARAADAGAVAGALRRRRRRRRRQRRAVRAFFEAHFIPYRITGADGSDTGLVTGYYEPLLARQPRAARRAIRVPLYARARRPAGRRPRGAAIPSSRTSACAAASTAGASCPTGRAPTSRQAARRCRQGARLRRRSGRGVLPADPGLGPHRARRRQRRCASATPTRTAIRTARSARVLIERGELTLERRRRCRASARGARRNPDAAAARCSTRIRATCSSARCRRRAPGTLDAAIDGPHGALGVPLLRERAIAVDRALRAARRAGVPGDDLPAVRRSRCSG